MDVVDIYLRDIRREQARPCDVFCAHLFLALAIAKTFRNRGVPFEDLIQEACLAMWEAYLEWDETFPFHYAARRSIKRALWRETKERGHCIRVPESHKTLKVRSLPDSIPLKQPDHADSRIDTLVLEQAIDGLAPKHADIIRRRLAGENRPSIASAYRVSVPSIASMEQTAISLLCSALDSPPLTMSLTELGVCSVVHTKDNGNVTYLEAFGKRQTLRQWAIDLGVSKDRIRTRLRRGCSVEQALTLPVHARKKAV